MNNRLFFDPVIPSWLGIFLIVALTILFLWIEQRKPAAFKSVRLVAIVVLMLAIAGILFQPSMRSETSGGVILLTENFSNEKVDSLHQKHPHQKLINVPGIATYRKSVTLESLHDLSSYAGEIAFVVGDGLPPEALELLDSTGFQFIPSEQPRGIINLVLPQQVYANRINRLDGVINNTSDSLKLILEGPGGNEDSVTIREKGLKTFQLRFAPKQSGRFLYQLSDGVKTESIPILVAEETPLKVLFIQHYPTFETRQLKDLLSKEHEMVFRYQLSQNKYRHEFINRTPQSIKQLNEKVLSDFDLLVIDSDGLKDLSSREVTSISQAVKRGLGVIILFNEMPSAKVTRDLLPLRFVKTQTDTTHLRVRGRDNVVLPAWPQQAQSTVPIVDLVKNKNRILSGYIPEGFGKIGFQLLQQTYQLALQGDSLTYSSLWSPLIGEIARKKSEALQVNFETSFPITANTPVSFQVFTGEISPVISYNNENIPLAENFWIDNVWHGKIWPDKPGWHSLTSNGVTIAEFYVSEPEAWQGLTVVRNLNETSKKDNDTRLQHTTPVQREIPKWIFFTLFILSAAFLWLSPKL